MGGTTERDLERFLIIFAFAMLLSLSLLAFAVNIGPGDGKFGKPFAPSIDRLE